MAIDWPLTLQAVQAGGVLIALAFGIDQVLALRRQRNVQIGIELLRPLQNPQMAAAILRVHDLPDNLDERALREHLGDDFDDVLALISMFEGLGPMVASGHVPLDLYAESYRGPTVIAWRKLRRFIEAKRASGWPSLFEWLQWLAERMESRMADRPAFERTE